MRNLLSLPILLFTCIIAHAQKRVSATSPDKQTTVTITLSDRIYFDVESHGERLFEHCHIGMTLGDCILGEKPVLKGKKVKSVNETITPIHPLKSSHAQNNYTQLTLTTWPRPLAPAHSLGDIFGTNLMQNYAKNHYKTREKS